MSTSLEEWVRHLDFLRRWVERDGGENIEGDGTDSAFAAILQNAKDELPLVEVYITALRATEEQNVLYD